MGEFETLDQDEPLAQRMERHAYDRMIMLSDGVFAIAITLAAIEIHPPANWDQTAGSLLEITGPALTSYAIAFIVISAYWMAHRRMIAMLRRVDGPATMLNLALLALVALQPAAIRLLTDYRINGAAGHIYYGQILLMGVTQVALWLYAWFAGLIDPSIRRRTRLFILGNIMVVPLIGSWVGVSLGRTSNFTAYILVLVLIVVSVTRRAIARRLGV